MRLVKIISGGQTGIDRAALDVAHNLNIDRGGWCPKGRLAEDGRIPEEYPLQEMDSAEYAERTEKNVIDSDGTLILTVGAPTGGTTYTIACAQRHEKPYNIVDLAQDTDTASVRRWVHSHPIAILNIAGPRLSESPQGYTLAYQFLAQLFEKNG